MNRFSIEQIQKKISCHKRRMIENNFLVRSAVLVPFLETSGGLSLLFTKRTEMVERHKGQISFPGGAADDDDGSPIATALRESFEEIGILPSSVKVLGLLNDLQTPSNFLITPVAGYVKKIPEFRISNEEVAEVLIIPFSDFLDETKRRSEIRTRGGKEFEVYFYDVWKEPVWGATGHIIKEMIDVLSQGDVYRT
ncbi:MAG: CoA pyrophosphatase [Bacteroidota bacterium]|nr:CoA pyrophosphatase [Bacteroidota bacterium]